VRRDQAGYPGRGLTIKEPCEWLLVVIIMRTILLIDLIESLSAVLDFMSPALSHHQVRVAFIARHLAEAAGLDEAGRHDLACLFFRQGDLQLNSCI
jgi:HD-GYP domain-containing protein (c-di-GMP phosphodiesterase class II)